MNYLGLEWWHWLSVDDLIHGLSPTCVIRDSVRTLGRELGFYIPELGNTICLWLFCEGNCTVTWPAGCERTWSPGCPPWESFIVCSSNFYSNTPSPLNQLLQQLVRCPCFTDESHFKGQFVGDEFGSCIAQLLLLKTTSVVRYKIK